jgi:hypothetical protein
MNGGSFVYVLPALLDEFQSLGISFQVLLGVLPVRLPPVT